MKRLISRPESCFLAISLRLTDMNGSRKTGCCIRKNSRLNGQRIRETIKNLHEARRIPYMTETLIQILNLAAGIAVTIVLAMICVWHHYHFFDKL